MAEASNRIGSGGPSRFGSLIRIQSFHLWTIGGRVIRACSRGERLKYGLSTEGVQDHTCLSRPLRSKRFRTGINAIDPIIIDCLSKNGICSGLAPAK